VRYGGPGAFVLGELDGAIGPRVKELGRLLAPVAELRLSDNVRGYKWAKHVYGALLFATALVDAHVYEVVERSRPVQRMLVALVAEGMALAAAARVRLEAFDEYDPELYRAAHGGDTAALDAAMAAVAHHYRTRTKTKTGIWRDLAVRKRKTEADGLFRVALEKAAQLRVPMPLTRRMIGSQVTPLRPRQPSEQRVEAFEHERVVVDEVEEDCVQEDPGHVAGRRIATNGRPVGFLVGGLIAGRDCEDSSRSEVNRGRERRVEADAA